MKLVNMTDRILYTSHTGQLVPGRSAVARKMMLVEALEETVRLGKLGLGLELDAREADLLSKVVEMDAKGCSFDRNSLPREALDDPFGRKRMEARMVADHKAQLDAERAANAASAKREAMIDGEALGGNAADAFGADGIAPRGGAPVSGFDAIMAENARIAQSLPEKSKEILDPIGAYTPATASAATAGKADAGKADAGKADANAGEAPAKSTKKARKAK